MLESCNENDIEELNINKGSNHSLKDVLMKYENSNIKNYKVFVRRYGCLVYIYNLTTYKQWSMRYTLKMLHYIFVLK